MVNKIKSLLKRTLVNTFFRHIRRSYSQSGEDIIISDLFTRLGISNPTYLDIGANHPIALSNTYRLYTRGSKGVCIEPNPVLFSQLKQKRKKDICINAGIAFNEQREADYYMFPDKMNGLNTFSKEEAEFWEQTGKEGIGKHKVENILKMKLLDINEVMKEYFSLQPDFISIDVEGLDLEIIQCIDFNKHKPFVFCVETLAFEKGDKEYKKENIINYLQEKGYFIYADTYINTIFCLKEVYQNIEHKKNL